MDDNGSRRRRNMTERKPGFLFQVITSHYQPGLHTKRLQTCVEEGHKLVSTGLFLVLVCCGKH